MGDRDSGEGAWPAVKRRYAFAQMYDLRIKDPWRDRQSEIMPSFDQLALLELNPGWELDTMAQRAREHALQCNFYAFTLHRATKGAHGKGKRWVKDSYHHVIEIRPMEIIGWT